MTVAGSGPMKPREINEIRNNLFLGVTRIVLCLYDPDHIVFFSLQHDLHTYMYVCMYV